MVKKLVKKLILTVCLCLPLFAIQAQRVLVYLNDDSCTVSVNTETELYPEYSIGLGFGNIRTYRIHKNDTTFFFKSMGCSQYAYDGQSFTEYLWLDYDWEDEACLCIDFDELPCRPDTSEYDVRITYRYVYDEPMLSVSKIRRYSLEPASISLDDYWNWLKIDNAEMLNFDIVKWDSAITFLSAIDWENYVELTIFNKTFRPKKYAYSRDITQTIINLPNSVMSLYWKLESYLLKKQQYGDYLNMRDNIAQYDKQQIKNKDSHFYFEFYSDYYLPFREYKNDLVKYLYPLQNREFKGFSLHHFQRNMNKIITNLYRKLDLIDYR